MAKLPTGRILKLVPTLVHVSSCSDESAGTFAASFRSGGCNELLGAIAMGHSPDFSWENTVQNVLHAKLELGRVEPLTVKDIRERIDTVNLGIKAFGLPCNLNNDVIVSFHHGRHIHTSSSSLY